MNLTVFATGDQVFGNCECIHGYAFKMVAPGVKSTLLMAALVQLRDRSVYLTVLNASRHLLTS